CPVWDIAIPYRRAAASSQSSARSGKPAHSRRIKGTAAMEISGTAAIVTGGGSGLGAETARMLAKAGARVAVLDLDGAKAHLIAEEIGGLGLSCDLGNAEE